MTALAKEEEECRFSGSSFLLSFLPSSVRITLAASRGRKWPGRKIHQLVLAFTLSGTRNKLMRWHFAQCSFKALVNFLPATETHLFLSPPPSSLARGETRVSSARFKISSLSTHAASLPRQTRLFSGSFEGSAPRQEKDCSRCLPQLGVQTSECERWWVFNGPLSLWS